ncbi:MAG: hypothetical protein AAB948_00075, partial [Patescibacteria group bacterium]
MAEKFITEEKFNKTAEEMASKEFGGEEKIVEKSPEAEEKSVEVKTEKENKIEIISPIGDKILNKEQIEEAKEIKENLGKTREKIAEFERVIEPGDVHDAVIEHTPGEETLLTEEEKKIEAEIEKMPDAEREKIGLGLHNFGFF